MGLDYSQKRLLSAAMRNKRNRKLRLYAFFTGLLSTVISLAHLVIIAAR